MTTTTKTADDVARELGFNPAAQFVTLDAQGRVGFTAGKPDEIAELACRAIRAGYAITFGLGKAAGLNAERINAIRAFAAL